MKRQKPRNALVASDAPYTDLGEIIMVPTIMPEVPKEEETDIRYSLDDTETLNPQQWTTRNKVIVGIHKLYDDVETPKYYTQKSACFDLPVYLGKDIVCVDVYNRMLMHLIKTVAPMKERDGERGFSIEPGESAFVPTGLIFDIPENFKLALYPRSGTAGKKHIKLSNCVGIVDEDFVKPVMFLIFNDSEQRQIICHGDRLAQAEIVPVYKALFEISNEPIAQKTDRDGGFGHTGTKVV